MASVSIGGIALTDWAVPNKIPFGGSHTLKVHKLIGGARVVHAMGPDPADISFAGRFRGSGAIGKAKALDALRVSGRQVSLSWLGLSYTVVVRSFRAETEKAFEVPYWITCLVVSEPTGSVGGIISTIDSMVGGDLTAALAPAALPALASNAITGLTGAISAAGTLQGAAASVISPILATANAAEATLVAGVAAADPLLNVASPDGSDPTVMASWLAGAATNMNAQAALVSAAGYVGRAAINLAKGSP